MKFIRTLNSALVSKQKYLYILMILSWVATIVMYSILGLPIIVYLTAFTVMALVSILSIWTLALQAFKDVSKQLNLLN